uniref:Uncharacterized protein n=1 Tax=Chromera velia CCMP2878 TaxID=1169474 RepID=A0A0G4HF90_9ALVE|eukprot:Cvel_26911.t1-p1 / transcript=Cvel_26911.t1 / gene=Cvel_26911 / organism=Chromera_velia_CCMP2878 / gene_product=hypothetical protein / transcript_product=hypothetical protein / location=Cvel_scaffold3272:3234-3971(-) / protein_length=246 / sequence_SO=supercontig / SO=protein_coding / is_pseudo=false
MSQSPEHKQSSPSPSRHDLSDKRAEPSPPPSSTSPTPPSSTTDGHRPGRRNTSKGQSKSKADGASEVGLSTAKGAPPSGAANSQPPCASLYRSTSQPDGPPDETDKNYPALPTAGRAWEATTAGLSPPSQPATVCTWGPVGRDKEKERRWIDAAALATNACRIDLPRVEQGRIKRAQWWEEERKGYAKAVGRARKEAREWRAEQRRQPPPSSSFITADVHTLLTPPPKTPPILPLPIQGPFGPSGL